MKKNSKGKRDDIRSEYDFSEMEGRVRGKYADRYREGTNVAVLEEDIAAAFPTDESVNRALRALLEASRSVRTKEPNKLKKKRSKKRAKRE